MTVDDVERRYVTPTHLAESDTIGPIPTRTFFVEVAVLALGGFLGWAVFQRTGNPWVSIIPGVLVQLLAIPFAQPFTKPGAEHGLGSFLSYSFRSKQLDPQHIKSLRSLRIEGKYIYLGDGTECRAILALPTVNLDLASTSSRRRHRRQLGLLLDGISSHQFQLLVRAEATQGMPSIERIRRNLNPFARQLAEWLAGHHEHKDSIVRQRYIIIPAPDEQTLEDRVDSITRSFRQAGLEPYRLEDHAELRALLDGWWTWQPHPERIGPARVTERPDHLQVDSEFVRVYTLAGVPSSIVTNWWQRLVDGDLAADVSVMLSQRDLAITKATLDMRYNNLAASVFNPGRKIAMDQIHALRMAMETSTRPWDVQVLLVVRAPTPTVLKRRTTRLVQQCRDLGVTNLRLMKWEQYAAMVAAQPLCLPDFLPSRKFLAETGTLARSTILSASTLQMKDGVPWGYSGASPILLTTRGYRSGKHFGWFGRTGAGKGYGVRTYLARRRFADRIRIFLWDADDMHHEYSGRFCEFLEGVTWPLKTLEDVDALRLDPMHDVVAFDVSAMPDDLQPKAFAKIKLKVEEHCLAFPRETAFLVDEATTLTEHPDQSGAQALGHAVQTWRKRGVEVHVLTQRVTDWFGTPVGRKIQGNLSVKWYGAQEDTEISEITRRANLSQEEAERIAGAGTGQGVLIAFGQRVWADLYEHTSPAEYEAYHTDPPEKAQVLTRSIA